MSEKSTIPKPQYTLFDGFAICLAMCHRLLAEVRALARQPGPAGEPGPEGKRGLTGERGEKGDRGEPGRPGAIGAPGIDGKDGRAGKDGRDGLSLEDFDFTSEDGGRKLVLTLSRGDTVIRKVAPTDIVLDRGVWREGQYQKGDGVTCSGSFFIAQRETNAKPETLDCGWRLAVKRGRDGKDGKEGRQGPMGQKGDKGDAGPRAYGG
jgi:collagen type III alpha